MTEQLAVGEGRRCRWCRRPLPDAKPTGRPRLYCRQACRQWDWVARQRARELHLAEGELVMTRAALDELQDRLFVLACAVQDVDRDLGRLKRPTTTDLRDALDWLLDAARPLVATDVAPAATT